MNAPQAIKIAVVASDGREVLRQYDRSRPDFGTAPDALLAGFAQLPDVEVHVLSCTQQRMTNPEKLADNIWFHSLHVPKLGWMRTGYSGCIRAVRRKLRELRPDIVHGQGTERECAISAVFSGFPNVITIHGNMRLVAEINRARPFSFGWLAARLEAFTLPRSNGVICITRYTRDAVADLAKKTWLLPNAVDPDFFETPRTHSEVPLLICVGVVCHRKNQNRFIRALDRLAATKPFRLVFLGGIPEGDYGREFNELIRTRPWCEYAGVAGRADLRNWFGRASMVVLPSLEDNCPMAVLEGMAARVPVLAANVGGVPDLVTDRETGVLCDPLDEESMACAVEMLLESPELAGGVAARARLQAEERYLPVAVARRHVEIYREVLSKR